MSKLAIDQPAFDFISFFVIVILLQFIANGLTVMALAKLIEESLTGNAITWQTALRAALSRLGALTWTGILAGLILIGLTLLLIVPGIIWSLYYAFFVFVVVLRGLSGKKALDYSKNIVKGQWWRVFLYLLVISLLGCVVTIAVSVPFLMSSGRNRLELTISNSAIYFM